MSIIAIVASTALWMTLSYRLAARRGRRPVLWAALAFGFGLFSLGLLALLPSRFERTKPIDPVAA